MLSLVTVFLLLILFITGVLYFFVFLRGPGLMGERSRRRSGHGPSQPPTIRIMIVTCLINSEIPFTVMDIIKLGKTYLFHKAIIIYRSGSNSGRARVR